MIPRMVRILKCVPKEVVLIHSHTGTEPIEDTNTIILQDRDGVGHVDTVQLPYTSLFKDMAPGSQYVVLP